MALMRVARHAGLVLAYDTDDVEGLEFATPNDVHDVTRPEDTAVRRELGQAHLHLAVHFKPGKRALWFKEEELTAHE